MFSTSAKLPLWYLHNTKQASPRDIVTATSGTGSCVALLFQTKQLAEGQVNSSPVFKAMTINTPAEWADFLTALEQRGITHVVIDPSGGLGAVSTVADHKRALGNIP